MPASLTISDLAVPTADGYLVAGFDVSTLSWGTLNTTTDVFTQGTSVTVDVGTGSFYGRRDYGAVFIDGIVPGNPIDYSAASIYFTPNPGYDPDDLANSRNPVKLAVADAFDGITEDDLTIMDTVKTPKTRSNDGSSMVGCGLQLPDPLGDLHGWTWQDINGDGVRTEIEPTNGFLEPKRLSRTTQQT